MAPQDRTHVRRFRRTRSVNSGLRSEPQAAGPDGQVTTAEVMGAGMQVKQQPILQVVKAAEVDEPSVEDCVSDFLEDLVALGTRHLSRLDPIHPRSAPWYAALVVIHRQAAVSLGRRRVRLASSG